MFLYVPEKVKYVKPARTCPYCRKTFKGGKLNRHVTTDHMQKFEDVKNATGLGSKGAFLKIRNMGILEHNKEEAREQRDEFASIRRCNTDIVHCQRCDGSYARRYFHRHQAHCQNERESRPEPVAASRVHLHLDGGFNKIIESFYHDEIGEVCRTDATIQQVGKLLWNKEKAKVDKKDEVRKSVMAAMRNLSRTFVEFRKLLPTDRNVDASALFDRKNWACLAEAVTNVTSHKDGAVKYGLKNTLYYLLMSSADMLEGVALTDTDSNVAAIELANFKKVLKHHENTVFADAKYLMNKARQERLRLPSRIPPEDAMKDLRNFTVKSIGEVDMEHCDRVTFVNLRNLVCSRLTMFNARRGGEPSRMTVDQWLNRHRWLNEKAMCDLTTAERALFQSMQIMYMTGKGNHLVTCLVPEDCVQAMNVLCRESVRSEAGIATTNTFIFPNTEGSSHHVDGWYTTKNVLGKAGIDCSIINATNQRGRISTMYASFEVAEEDRAYFFKHMGHSEHVNVGTYQRPLPVLAMTKVGAVLANIDASMAVQKRRKPQEPQGNAAI